MTTTASIFRSSTSVMSGRDKYPYLDATVTKKEKNSYDDSSPEPIQVMEWDNDDHVQQGTLEYGFITIPMKVGTKVATNHSMMNEEEQEMLSQLSLGSDYLEYEGMEDWSPFSILPSPITEPSFCGPKICTIAVCQAMETGLDFSISIANPRNYYNRHCYYNNDDDDVVDLTEEQIVEFCMALTEYDSSWIFHIRPSGTSLVVEVTAHTIDKALRYLLSM